MKSLWILLLFFTTTELIAQSTCHGLSGTGVSTEAGTGGIVFTTTDPSLASALSKAISNWNGCDGTLPDLKVSGSAAVAVEVIMDTTQAEDNDLAEWDNTLLTITVHPRTQNGNLLGPGELESILNHEIGHVLGLDDVNDNSCLMGPGKFMFGDLQPKVVSGSDCSFLVSVWYPHCQPN